MIIRKIFDPFYKEGPQPVKDYIPKKINSKRQVYTWGLATTGCLGNPSFVDPSITDKIKSPNIKAIHQFCDPYHLRFFKDFKSIVDVAAGHGFTLFAVVPDRSTPGQSSSLYGTGINAYNQLGRQEYRGKRLTLLIEPVPIFLPIDSDDKVIKVAAGRCHTIVLTQKGKVLSFGNNCYGQLGRPVIDNEDYTSASFIHKIQVPEEVVDIICGQDHTLFLTKNGAVYSCGLGADGQTGVGHFENIGVPKAVKGDIEGEKIVEVSSCADTVLAVNDKGDVFGWGNNEYLQLKSVSDEEQINVSRRLPLNSSIGKVIKVTAGGSSCGLINERNEVYVWGFGILGKGPKVNQLKEPSMIPKTIFACDDITGNNRNQVTDLVAGLRHFAAITSQGDLYTWGRNRNGCLGHGGVKNKELHPPDYFFPVKVDIPAAVTKVAFGVDHTVAFCRTIL